MERILVPLDGSALSEAIVPAAEVLARDYGAGLLLLRVVPTRTAPGSGVLEPDARAGRAEAYLGRIAEDLQRRGVSQVRRSVWYWSGQVDRAIAEAALQNRVDLIAMTTHGRGGLSRLLLGSVAESVVRRAPAPVLLVRGQPSWRDAGVTRILVPLDGSELSAEILPIVERLAGPLDLTVVLLHAVEPIDRAAAAEVAARLEEITAIRQADADAYLSKVAEDLQGKGLRVRHAVRIGAAFDVIQELAREEGIGLIAMTTHGRTGLGRLFFGSVAEHVVRTSTVPMLLWKARENGGTSDA